MTGPGVLSQRSLSADEFERRCSVIATLLDGFTTGVQADKAPGTKGKRPAAAA